MLFIRQGIEIPESECQFTFARSGGPGGQNVNKVNSKAIMRWSIVNSRRLPNDVRARFMAKYANRITADGELILISQKYRDQNRNIEECFDKLTKMIISVAFPATPRKATKPTVGSKLRRRQSKRQHTLKKQGRRSPQIDE